MSISADSRSASQSKRFGFIPLRTVWGAVGVAVVLGLLCLIAPAASSALFSLAVAGGNVAWGIPIFARAVWGRDKFTPGPFYTGWLSLPIAWAAVTFMVYGTFLAMFPVGGPNPTAQDMNYTVIINTLVWGGCSLYYFVDARKWFTGPKSTVAEVQEVLGRSLSAGQRDGSSGDGKTTEADGSGPESEKKSVVAE